MPQGPLFGRAKPVDNKYEHNERIFVGIEVKKKNPHRKWNTTADKATFELTSRNRKRQVIAETL
jgi:hypothetical protein